MPSPSLRRAKQTPVRYTNLAAELRVKIQSGELAVGTKLPSYLEMQNVYGAATYTLDRAYSVLEKEGLIERRARSGVYVAEAQPQVKAGVVQDVVGLVSTALTDYRHHPYFVELLMGVQEGLEASGNQVMLFGGSLPSIPWEKVGGVILFEMKPQALSNRVAQLPPGMPTVSLLESCEGASSVVMDDYAGARLATEHLIQLGHTRIAYLLSDALPIGKRRVNGYLDAMHAAGLAVDPAWRRSFSVKPPAYDFFSSGREAARAWLDNGWAATGCTALFCQNDEVAAGVLQVFGAAGIQTPANVSIFGFDDQRICALVSPALSTVRVPLREVGQRAALMLSAQMADQTEGLTSRVQSVVLPASLVIRDSCSGPGSIIAPSHTSSHFQETS